MIAGLAWGGGIVAVALAMTWARRQGYVDSDTVTRVVICLNGFMIAWYGNRMPKRFFPDALARKVSRLGGWSITLGGLAYAGLWMFAPFHVAVAAGSAAVLAGVAVPLVYCFSQRHKLKNAG
ncbi:MAG: ammonium transporter [Rubrivivax sp.]|nr:MAG: ammonium transporter [Rubrivivax sp.]